MDIRTFLKLLVLASLWGPSFLFIRWAVEDIPPITVVAGRMLGAATLLYAVLRLRGGRLPRDARVWRHMTVVALSGTGLPFGMVGWAEQHVDSAVTSILNATVPIFTLLFAHFMTDDDRLNGTKIVGMVLGLLGAVLLIVPAIQAGMQADALGLTAVTFASVCYALAGVYARTHVSRLEPLVAPTMQFAISAIVLAPFSLIVDQPWTIETPSATAIGAWIGLILIGTVAAFVLYYRLLAELPPSALSMVTYLMPVIAVALGVFVGGETLGWNAYAGCLAILLGVVAVNRRPRSVAEKAVP